MHQGRGHTAGQDLGQGGQRGHDLILGKSFLDYCIVLLRKSTELNMPFQFYTASVPTKVNVTGGTAYLIHSRYENFVLTYSIHRM